MLFPRASLSSLPHVGSDHSPLILDLSVSAPTKTSRFQFDASWLMIDGFVEMVSENISSFLLSRTRTYGAMDD